VAAPTSDTRERILDTAEALFAEKGFAATSVREIAAACSLTPASLYNHFDGKEALYSAVLERGLVPLMEALDAPEAGAGGEPSEAAILPRIMAAFGQRPNLPRLVYQEAVSGGATLVPLIRPWIPPLVARALDTMKRDLHPAFPEEDLRRVIGMWVQLVVGYFAVAPLMAEFLDEEPLAPDAIERQTRFLLDITHRIATGESAREGSPS